MKCYMKCHDDRDFSLFDCLKPQARMATMKAHVLAAALDGRVMGAADVEISRAVHPAEASCEGDVAIAVSADTIRILAESQAKIALVPEGTQIPLQSFQTVIFMRRSRSSLPAITQAFRYCPEIHPGVHPSAVVASDAVIGEGASIGPLVVHRPGRIGRGPLGHPVASDARGRRDARRGLPRLSRRSHWLGMPCRRSRRPAP